MERLLSAAPYWLRWMTSLFHSAPLKLRISAWCGVTMIFVCLFYVLHLLSQNNIDINHVYLELRKQGAPLALDSSLAYTWAYHIHSSWDVMRSSVGTASGDEWLQRQVSPQVPPFLCHVPGDPPGPSSLHAMARAWRALDQERAARILTQDAVDRFNESVGRFLQDSSLPQDSFIHAYNRGLAIHLAGSAGDAARTVGEIAQGSPEFLPTLPLAEARTWATRNRISEDEVRKAVASRYLLGLIQLGRDNGQMDALRNFRLGISGFNYLIPPQSPISRGEGIELFPSDDWSCDAGVRHETPGLTSINAYQGLVAAYLLSPTQSVGVWANRSAEFSRPDGSMDPSDVLAPFVRIGQRGGSTPSAGPIPENVLWAASNLQRLRTLNPSTSPPWFEPLTLTLGVLTLAQPDWMDAYLGEAQGNSCSFARRLLEEVGWRRYIVATSTSAHEPYKGQISSLVSYLDGAYHAACEEGSALSQEEQSLVLRFSTAYSQDPYPGILEHRRLHLLTGRGGSAAAEAIWDSLSLEERRIENRQPLTHFGSPAAGLHTGPLASQWRSSVFRDLALATAHYLGDERGPGFEDEELLLALFDAAHLAGLRPRDLFRGQDVDISLSGASFGSRTKIGIRYRYHNAPILGRLILFSSALLSVCAMCLALFLAWRYNLLSSSMYIREKTYRLPQHPVTQSINEDWLGEPGPRG